MKCLSCSEETKESLLVHNVFCGTCIEKEYLKKKDLKSIRVLDLLNFISSFPTFLMRPNLLDYPIVKYFAYQLACVVKPETSYVPVYESLKVSYWLRERLLVKIVESKEDPFICVSQLGAEVLSGLLSLMAVTSEEGKKVFMQMHNVSSLYGLDDNVGYLEGVKKIFSLGGRK